MATDCFRLPFARQRLDRTAHKTAFIPRLLNRHGTAVVHSPVGFQQGSRAASGPQLLYDDKLSCPLMLRSAAQRSLACLN
eukprot:6205240-Pleurochrysis_carterae.AAC.1